MDANTHLRAKAQALADAVIAADVGVQAVVLYGSVATGEAVEGSDIDLLMLADTQISGRKVRAGVHNIVQDVFNVVYYTPQTLEKSRQRDWTYVACLYDQSVLLAGDAQCIEWLETPTPEKSVSIEQIQRLRKELSLKMAVRRLSPRHDAFEIYRQVRQAAVLLCCTFGYNAWRRTQAFEQTHVLLPEVKEQLQLVQSLYPQWESVHRGTHADDITSEECEAALVAASDIFKDIEKALS